MSLLPASFIAVLNSAVSLISITFVAPFGWQSDFYSKLMPWGIDAE